VIVMTTTTCGTGQVRALLAGLGKSADGVARTLHQVGITGRRDSLCGCPVANYLCDRTGLPGIEVTQAEVLVDLPDGTSGTVFTPRPVAEFITRFDLGAFGYLDASMQPTPLADPGTTCGPEVCP
jgi:hypothetical protein